MGDASSLSPARTGPAPPSSAGLFLPATPGPRLEKHQQSRPFRPEAVSLYTGPPRLLRHALPDMTPTNPGTSQKPLRFQRTAQFALIPFPVPSLSRRKHPPPRMSSPFARISISPVVSRERDDGCSGHECNGRPHQEPVLPIAFAP